MVAETDAVVMFALRPDEAGAEDEDEEVGEAILGTTDPAAVSLATTRVRARFSDLSRSFSVFSFGICCGWVRGKEEGSEGRGAW